MSRNRRPVMQSDVRRMHELADRGLHHAAIARLTGRNRETVRRYLGTKGAFYQKSRLTADDVREWHEKPALADREGMADRFGYASAASMQVIVCRTQKRLAAQGIDIPTGRDRMAARVREKVLRLKKDYEARPRGEKGMSELAERYGYASEASVLCALSRARKIAAEARA